MSHTWNHTHTHAPSDQFSICRDQNAAGQPHNCRTSSDAGSSAIQPRTPFAQQHHQAPQHYQPSLERWCWQCMLQHPLSHLGKILLMLGVVADVSVMGACGENSHQKIRPCTSSLASVQAPRSTRRVSSLTEIQRAVRSKIAQLFVPHFPSDC